MYFLTLLKKVNFSIAEIYDSQDKHHYNMDKIKAISR